MNKLICFIIESLLVTVLTVGVGALLVAFVFALSGNVVMAIILSVFIVIGLILIARTVLAESWEGVKEYRKSHHKVIV
jgi:hypothetical protein